MVRGKATVEPARLLEAMVEDLMAAVSVPKGSTMAAPSATGEDESGA